MLEKLSFTERYVLHLLLDDMDLCYSQYRKHTSNLTNSQIARILEMSERQVVRYIKKLQKLRYIDVEYFDNNKREIRMSQEFIEKVDGGK